jgi:creatinine deaminase
MAEDEAVRSVYRHALEEARAGMEEGGIPIGAALARNGEVLGRGHNRRVQRGDPTAHAEIEALRDAGRIRDYRDTILYTTLTPCYLCAGAAVLLRIPRVVAGETSTYDGEGSLEFLAQQGIHVTDLDDGEAKALLQRFIQDHEEIWKEDTGKSSN